MCTAQTNMFSVHNGTIGTRWKGISLRSISKSRKAGEKEPEKNRKANLLLKQANAFIVEQVRLIVGGAFDAVRSAVLVFSPLDSGVSTHQEANER
jgi:hypothetical protein